MKVMMSLRDVLIVLTVAVLVASSKTAAITDPVEGRYSFSLTTFHPSGKLPQLSYATKASTLGPPVIAFKDDHGIVLVSLQSLPSPLICDDGTARFAKITDSILIGHTGVNADGRVVAEAAQRLAVEHAYTFEEEIPMDVLLEDLALLYQEYTMKAGVRPFGCCMIVAGLEDGIYQIDPAGTVTKLSSPISFSGRGDGEMIKEKIMKRITSGEDGELLEDIERILVTSLEDVAGVEHSSCQSIICARLSRENGLSDRMRRFFIDDRKDH